MRINHNISALQTNAHMRKTGNALDKAMEKLSSGYKINRASDDAAGMAISRKMRTQIDGLERASMNGSDGISVADIGKTPIRIVSGIELVRRIYSSGISEVVQFGKTSVVFFVYQPVNVIYEGHYEYIFILVKRIFRRFCTDMFRFH